MKYSPNSLHYYDQEKTTSLCGSPSGQDVLKLCVQLCVWCVTTHSSEAKMSRKSEQEQTLNNKNMLEH